MVSSSLRRRRIGRADRFVLDLAAPVRPEQPRDFQAGAYHHHGHEHHPDRVDESKRMRMTGVDSIFMKVTQVDGAGQAGDKGEHDGECADQRQDAPAGGRRRS